jgi:hypothetical protein
MRSFGVAERISEAAPNIRRSCRKRIYQRDKSDLGTAQDLKGYSEARTHMAESVPPAVQTLDFVELVLCLTERVSYEVVDMVEGFDPY